MGKQCQGIKEWRREKIRARIHLMISLSAGADEWLFMRNIFS
jgi:hypothetical protein